MTAPLELYPLSTSQQDAIPLDIIRPLAAVKLTVPASGVATFAVPADWKLGVFFCPEGCMIQFNAALLPNPPVSGTIYADTLVVPPNSAVTATVIPGTMRVTTLTGVLTYLTIQHIQKWAAIALEHQLIKR